MISNQNGLYILDQNTNIFYPLKGPGMALYNSPDGYQDTGGSTANPNSIFALADDTTALLVEGQAPTLVNIKSMVPDFTDLENVTKVVCTFHVHATVLVGITPGVYVAFNASGNGVSELSPGGPRYWIPAGKKIAIPFRTPTKINTIHVIAMCPTTSNIFDIEPG